MQIEKACWNLELQVRRWKVAGKVFQFQVQLQSKLVSQRVRRSQTLFPEQLNGQAGCTAQ